MSKKAFVTVGSTQFPSLIRQVFSPEFFDLLISKNYSSLSIQHGSSPIPSLPPSTLPPITNSNNPNNSYIYKSKLQISTFEYNPSLSEYFNSHLVISHAGSGSILESLNSQNNEVLVAVVNEELMDNHQQELAVELSGQGYLVSCNLSELLDTLGAVGDAYKRRSWEKPDGSVFRDIFNQELRRITRS